MSQRALRFLSLVCTPTNDGKHIKLDRERTRDTFGWSLGYFSGSVSWDRTFGGYAYGGSGRGSSCYFVLMELVLRYAASDKYVWLDRELPGAEDVVNADLVRAEEQVRFGGSRFDKLFLCSLSAGSTRHRRTVACGRRRGG